MIRISIAAAALALGTGAGPISSASVAVTRSPGAEIIARMESRQHQQAPTSGFTSAPMPNADIGGPVVAGPAPGEASLAPTIVSSRPGYRGEGFLPGSVGTPDESKKNTPSPGVNLNVSLQ